MNRYDAHTREPSKTDNTFLEGFCGSFKESAVTRPYAGLTQTINHIVGTELLPQPKLEERQAQTVEASVGQWVGNAIGGAVPFVAMYRLIGSGAAGKLEMTNKFGITMESVPVIGKSAVAGATYGVLFEPVSSQQDFWRGKLASAASTGVAAALMTGGEIGLKSTGAKAFQNDIVLGMTTGFPTGMVSTNVNSLVNDGKLTSLSESVKSGFSMAAVGGFLGGANLLHEHVKPTTGIHGIRGLRDLTAANDAAVKVTGEPTPFYHVIQEIDSPLQVKDLLDGNIQYLPPHSRETISSGAADLTASHEALKDLGPRAVFYASARLKEDSFEYQRIRSLSRQLAEMGYTIITGGGPGGMEAASRGAFEGGGTAVGVRVNLPFEEAPNKYIDIATLHKDVSTRIEALTKLPDVYVVERSGWGTDAETMFALGLLQLRHVSDRPVYLVDKGHWSMIEKVWKQQARDGLISKRDLDLYKITDDTDRIARELKALKPRLDQMHAQRKIDNEPYMAQALPRRHTVSKVSGNSGTFSFTDFLHASPDQFAELAVQPSNIGKVEMK
ncbi:MAG TPA: LOG family protein [Drouetiella sp.]